MWKNCPDCGSERMSAPDSQGWQQCEDCLTDFSPDYIPGSEDDDDDEDEEDGYGHPLVADPPRPLTAEETARWRQARGR